VTEHDRQGVRVHTFESFDAHEDVIAFVTTRAGGESVGPYASLNLGMQSGDDPAVVERNRARVAALAGAPAFVLGKQVHGKRVAVVPDGYSGGAFDDTDALITTAARTPLAVLTADCAAVFLFDPENRAIGIAHAGWRGAVAAIAALTVARMGDEFDTDPADLIAAIGPSIGPCCYEVGAEVMDAFSDANAEMAEEILVDPELASAGSFRASVNEGRKHLDLWRANELMLIAAGVREDAIEVSRLCTVCRRDVFYSHRAEKGITGRFAGVIALR
jgi:purine-nucleoside/S-methyl-5'-thioadenosine phosphorylase / adenosine deaminase